MRDHDQRPPLRRAVHAHQRRWKAYLTQYLRTDERGMRGKAGGANCGDESRDRTRKSKTKRGRRLRRPQ